MSKPQSVRNNNLFFLKNESEGCDEAVRRGSGVPSSVFLCVIKGTALEDLIEGTIFDLAKLGWGADKSAATNSKGA